MTGEYATKTDYEDALVFLEYYETVFPKATSVLQQVGVISTVSKRSN
jgi:hypothetical protein